MPQNAWKLLFKFKRISLKRCIMFKQSFYLLAHWMQKWHLFIISTRGWSKKIKSIVNCGDMQPSRRSRDGKNPMVDSWDSMYTFYTLLWYVHAIKTKMIHRCNRQESFATWWWLSELHNTVYFIFQKSLIVKVLMLKQKIVPFT